MAKRKNTKTILIVISVLVIIGALGYSAWRIMQLRKTAADLGSQLNSKTEELNTFRRDLVANPTGTLQKIQQESTQSIIDEVGKLYTLPANESPTVATVQDKSKLGDQEFFKDAQNNDVLVVYEKSGLAILYRPSEKKLVKVGPINIQNNPETSETTN